MSAAARRIWDRLTADMDPSVLRRTDQDALASLAEDEALLAESYAGLRAMVDTLRKRALAEKKTLPGGPLAALLTMPNGRLALAAIRDLAARLIVERREFGLTPAARTRVSADGWRADSKDDLDLDDAIFNRKAELLVRKPN